MASYTDITVSDTWVSLFDTIGITDTNTSLRVQNKGSHSVLASINTTAPEEDSQGIMLLTGDSVTLPTATTSCWLKSGSQIGGSKISVADATLFLDSTTIPPDIYTSTISGVRRLSVDSQQTSFEQNEQFRFVDSFDDFAYASSILYKFTITNPINLFERTLSVYEGGREYYVYPYNESDTFTGSAFGTQRVPTPMNNLLRDGLTEHPSTSVTVERYTVTAFTPTEDWIDKTFVLTDGNSNRATDTFSSDNLRFGTGAASTDDPAVFWVYLPSIGSSNNVTNGYLRLVWEERTE